MGLLFFGRYIFLRLLASIHPLLKISHRPIIVKIGLHGASRAALIPPMDKLETLVEEMQADYRKTQPTPEPVTFSLDLTMASPSAVFWTGDEWEVRVLGRSSEWRAVKRVRLVVTPIIEEE